jgi:oligosaccharide repeat unit polymerase
MLKSRFLFLFNIHLTIGIIQLILYFAKPSINFALTTNFMTVSFGFFSMYSLALHLHSSIFSFPHTWFLISVSYLFCLVPILHITNVDYTNELFPGFAWEAYLGNAILISGLFMNFILIVSIPYLLRRFNGEIYFGITKIKINWGIFVFVLAYSIFGFATWLSQIGGLSALFLTRSSFTQSGMQFQNGYLYASLNFGFGAILVLLIQGLYSRNRKVIAISCSLAIIFMLPDLIRGTRVNGLFAIVCCVCALSLYRNSIGEPGLFSRLKWILILLAIPLIIIAPRLYRVQRNISLNSFSQAFDGKNLFDSFAGYDSAMDIGLSIFLNSKLDLGYGRSYLEAILRPIPRAIWSGKPYELDVYFNQVIFPETASHVGISFSGFSEPIYNFGLVGVILFALIVGWLSSLVFLKYKNGEIRYLLLTVFLSAFSFNLLRGNLSSSYSQLVFPLIASLIVINRDFRFLNVGSSSRVSPTMK